MYSVLVWTHFKHVHDIGKNVHVSVICTWYNIVMKLFPKYASLTP